MKGRFWRKALAAALALLVVSGNVPIRSVADLFGGAAITASALESEASGQCGENATWVYDRATGTLTISGTGDMGSVGWADYKDEIAFVIIGDGITSICDSAFAFCNNLTSVEIPDSVENIGDSAFEWCGRLESVNIPDSVTSIGDFAFEGCTALNSVTIPNSVTSIGNFAFEECTRLESAVIGNSVTSIGIGAFGGCTGLTSIEIPDSVTSIGRDAFCNCTNIEEVSCDADPDKLTWNEYGCDDFIYDSGNAPDVHYTTVCHVPAKYYLQYVKKFGAESENPVNVTFDTDAPHGQCGESAYWLFDSGKLTISGTGDMDDYEYNTQPWYNYMDNITSVEIEYGVKSIGSKAFYYCEGLTSIKIPDSVESIGDEAFFSCKGLKSIKIPGSVTSIGEYAFFSCTGLTSITIPDSVKSIGASAFSWCTNLTSVTISNSVKSIDELTFYYCTSLEKIKIPASVKSIGEAAFDGCTGLKSIEIPDSVESIGNHALRDCTSLTSIKIPDSVESIGEYAFAKCTSLTSIEIPDSVTSISKRTFYGCTVLTSIEISKNVTSISEGAFYACTGITDVYCYANPEDLTWNEDGCDDFMGNPESRETICHVPKNYLEDYEAKFGAGSENPVNVTFVGDVDMGLGEHLYGYSITLDGSIGVNFYVELTDELLASETAEMVFTVPNGSKTDTQNLLVKDVIAKDGNKVVIGSKTYYKFKCSVSAKDMASEITAQLVDGEKSGEKYTYSVKDYADYLLSHTEVEQYAKAAALIKAMLNYGAYSQSYFGEGTPLAESYKAAVDDVSVPVVFEYDDNAKLPEGVTFEGATLSLKSETTLSLYFKGLAEKTEFTCGGKTVETAKNGEYVVARIRGIKASELENDFTVKVGESSETYNVTYNVMTYCYNVLSDDTVDDNLKNVCKALYQYAEEAREYFGGNN